MASCVVPQGAAAVAAFSPADLFAASEVGVWYDPSDLSSMFQDSAGTTPAVVDQPVGRINDKSGNGYDATQTTTASKPVLRQDGSGNYYLEHDGVDDWLRALFTIAQPWDRVSAFRQISWAAFRRIMGGGSTTAGSLLQRTSSPTLALFSSSVFNVSGPAIGSNAIFTERHNGASSRGATNSNAYTTGNAGTTAPGGVTIGANYQGAEASSVYFYGAAMIGRALTDTETSDLRSFMASKAGVTL